MVAQPFVCPLGPVDRDDGSEIYTMNVDGSEVVRLTDNGFTDRDPAWSPDGQTLALVRAPTGSATAGDVWLIDVESQAVLRCKTTNISDAGLFATSPIGFGTMQPSKSEPSPTWSSPRCSIRWSVCRSNSSQPISGEARPSARR